MSDDGFTFSAEIEAELAGLEAQETGGSSAAHEHGQRNGTKAATTAASPSYATSASSSRAAAAPSAAIRAATANPSAYAAEHFSRPTPASAASPYRSGGSAHVRRLSIDAAQAEAQKQASAAWNPSASAASSSSIAFSADASPQHRAFYEDDAHYFNLGGSSFPLLPHNSLYEDELLGEQIGNGRSGTRTPGTPIGPEKAFSPSGRVHAQHFSSILNQPASRLQYAAGPALSGASGYLPSLSSIWTFTTGVQPPEMVSRASYELTSFAEEAQSVDDTPFVLPPCPGLNEGDIDLAVVGRYLQSMKPLMAAYRKNHPREGFAHKAAAIKARESERAQASSVQTQLRARANASKAKEKRRMHGSRIDEESDEEKETMAYGQYANSSAAAATPAFSSSLDPLNDDDAALSLSLARDLRACYSEIPSVYFSESFNMASLDFLAKRDPKEEALIAGLNNRTTQKNKVDIPGAKGGINPYASFDALSSYHNSQHFTLPSLADQKAAQLQAYRESQERLAFMHDLNEKHLSLQVELSAYLDTVECNLLQQISHKSWIFFDALKHMQQISEEIALCLEKITLLRANVSTLKSNLSSAGLGVLQQIRTIDNTRQLIHKLELIATVIKTSPTVQLLLSTGDFSAGMQLIHSTKLVLSGELKGLTCLRHVQVKLDEHAKLIGSMMRLEFVGVAIRGASFYLHDFNPAATTAQGLRGNKSAKIKASAIAHSRSLSEEEQERLVPLVSHLLELGQLGSVFEVYREELQTILKQRLMDLVYELLNQLRDETDASAAAGASAPTSKQNGKAHDGDSSDEDDEDDGSPRVSEKDEVAANSLFSDAVVPPADKDEAPTAAGPTVDAAPASTAEPAALSPSAAASHGASPPVAQPVSAAGAPRYGERKQAAVAMPVGANGALLRAPSQAAAVPSPSAAAAAASAITPTAASSSPVITPAVATAPTPALTLAAPPQPSTSPAASISSRFSSLQHSEFLSLLQPLFTSLMDLLQRASTIRHLALTVLTNSALPAPQKESLTRELNDALISLLEFTHAKIGKILQTRSGVHAELELRQLRQYLDVILNFIQEGEKMAGKTCYGLRGTLLVQAKAFLVSFHARCMQVLATSLEKEKWVRVDVPPEYQSLLDAQFIVKRVEIAAAADAKAAAAGAAASASAASDPFADSSSSASILDTMSGSSAAPAPTVKASVPSWQSAEDGAEEDEKSSSAPSAVAASPPALVKSESKSSEVTRVLFVPRTGPKGVAVGGFLKFPVVQSLLVLLQIIGQYIECSAQLQAVGSDILNRLVELLQVFNSRSCQLVLGAGAMHLSGLKSITASHLALASQSVGLLVTQVPVLRAVLSSRLPSKHHVLLHSLERVSQDCQEHQREIFAKLVGIMDELVRSMREKMEQLPWAKPVEVGAAPVALSTADASTVDECVKTLMKQTCSLHRALSDLLLAEQRDLIFRDISHRFLRHIGEFAAGMDQSNPTVKIKMAYNINHISTRLKTCTGVNEDDVQQLAKFVLV